MREHVRNVRKRLTPTTIVMKQPIRAHRRNGLRLRGRNKKKKDDKKGEDTKDEKKKRPAVAKVDKKDEKKDDATTDKTGAKHVGKKGKAIIMDMDVSEFVIPPKSASGDTKKNFRSRAHKKGERMATDHTFRKEKAIESPRLCAREATKRWTELHGRPVI